MSTINISPLIDALGGDTATGATGTIVAVVMAGGVPATRIAGTGVILPKPVEVSFKDGVLTDPLVLDELPANYYWKFTICVGDICQTYYFTIAGAGPYDFDELTFIDVDEMVIISPLLFPEPVAYNPNIVGLTGETVTGTYIKYGKMVYVAINVALGSVSNFGTTQYSFALPFAAESHQDVFAGSVHDAGVTTSHWSLKCHLDANSTTANIFYLTRAGGDAVLDAAFDYNSPFLLTTADTFHLAFWYEGV